MAKGIYEHARGTGSNNYRHGQRHTRLYRIWVNMKTRCYNTNYPRYDDYGGRGIRICAAWFNDFTTFYYWAMSHGYTDKLTLDRIDNNGNYEPSNCRWVDYHTQRLNTRTTRTYEYNGIIFHLCEVEELFNVKRTVFQKRIKRGWTCADAIGGVKNS